MGAIVLIRSSNCKDCDLVIFTFLQYVHISLAHSWFIQWSTTTIHFTLSSPAINFLNSKVYPLFCSGHATTIQAFLLFCPMICYTVPVYPLFCPMIYYHNSSLPFVLSNDLLPQFKSTLCFVQWSTTAIQVYLLFCPMICYHNSSLPFVLSSDLLPQFKSTLCFVLWSTSTIQVCLLFCPMICYHNSSLPFCFAQRSSTTAHLYSVHWSTATVESRHTSSHPVVDYIVIQRADTKTFLQTLDHQWWKESTKVWKEGGTGLSWGHMACLHSLLSGISTRHYLAAPLSPLIGMKKPTRQTIKQVTT